MMRLRREGGLRYYGGYWLLIEAMRERPELGFRREFLEAEFYGLGIDDETGHAIVKLCIEAGAFDESEGVIFSPALRKRVAAFDAKCEANRLRVEKSRSRSSNVPVMRTETLHNGCVPINPNIQSIIDNNLYLNNKDTVLPPAQPPHALDGHFATPTGKEPWECDARYVNMGQRPMKKYPALFLDPVTLQEIFDKFDEMGLPPNRNKNVFEAVRDRLKTAQDPSRVNVSVWLKGWALTDALQQCNAANNNLASEKRLAGVGR
jgi:hypothetical protein